MGRSATEETLSLSTYYFLRLFLLQLSSLTTCSLLMLTFYLLNFSYKRLKQVRSIQGWHCLYEPQKRGQCDVWPLFGLANPTHFFPKGLHRKPQETKGGERGVLSKSLKDFS
jgi:hypothetical protein